MNKTSNSCYTKTELREIHNFHLFVYAMKCREALPWNEDQITDFYLMLKKNVSDSTFSDEIYHDYMRRESADRKTLMQYWMSIVLNRSLPAKNNKKCLLLNKQFSLGLMLDRSSRDIPLLFNESSTPIITLLTYDKGFLKLTLNVPESEDKSKTINVYPFEIISFLLGKISIGDVFNPCQTNVNIRLEKDLQQVKSELDLEFVNGQLDYAFYGDYPTNQRLDQVSLIQVLWLLYCYPYRIPEVIVEDIPF